VSDTKLPVGASEPKHSHLRGVTIPLAPYDNETVAYPAGTRTKRHTDFAEVRWAEPVTHESLNTGSTLQHVIRVELLKEAGASGAAVVEPLTTQRVLVDNAYVRVIEDNLPPGGSEPVHRHGRGVIVPLTSAELEVTEGGKTEKRSVTFGEADWREPVVHSVKNVGSTPLRLVRVELK
jgi:quercetin dioxygenase-like cupin family protein